jgi:hypothetical protein
MSKYKNQAVIQSLVQQAKEESFNESTSQYQEEFDSIGTWMHTITYDTHVNKYTGELGDVCRCSDNCHFKYKVLQDSYVYDGAYFLKREALLEYVLFEMYLKYSSGYAYTEGAYQAFRADICRERWVIDHLNLDL